MKNSTFLKKATQIHEKVRGRFFCQLAETESVLPYRSRRQTVNLATAGKTERKQGEAYLYDRRAASSYKVIRFRFQLVGKKIDYGLFRKFGVVFLEKLNFSYASTYFLDFPGVKGHGAEAHAKGFARLQTFRQGLTQELPTTRGAKDVKKLKIFVNF